LREVTQRLFNGLICWVSLRSTQPTRLTIFKIGSLLKHKFISAYQIVGATRPADRDEEVIVEYPSLQARAILTYDAENYLFEIDRATAIANIILNLTFGKLEKYTFENGLQRELEKIATTYQKVKRDRDGVFVVFEAEGVVESWTPSNKGELDDFVIVFNAVDKAPIYEQYQTSINGILSSFSLGCGSIYELKKIQEGIYFIEDHDKPVYSYSFKCSAIIGNISAPITADQLCYVKNNAKIMGEHKELVNSARLLIQSLDENSDTLLAFLAAWNGLEILIQKIFKTYETNMFNRVAEDKNVNFKGVDKIRTVMKDKYRLVDKFSIISSELIPDEADEDIDEFKSIKCDYRDKLMHGKDVPLSSLPTERVRILLKKYLKLHIARLSK